MGADDANDAGGPLSESPRPMHERLASVDTIASYTRGSVTSALPLEYAHPKLPSSSYNQSPEKRPPILLRNSNSRSSGSPSPVSPEPTSTPLHNLAPNEFNAQRPSILCTNSKPSETRGGALDLTLSPHKTSQQYSTSRSRSSLGLRVPINFSSGASSGPRSGSGDLRDPASPPVVSVEVTDDFEDILSFERSLRFDPLGEFDAMFTFEDVGRTGRVYNHEQSFRLSPSTLLTAEQSDGEYSGDSVSSSLPSSVGSPLHRARTFSSDYILPAESPLLIEDGLETDSVVRRNDDGQICAGTLAGLVDELLLKTKYGE